MNRRTRIYVLFATAGYDTLRLHVNRSVPTQDGRRIPANFVSNDEVVSRLAAAMPDVEFTARSAHYSGEGMQRLLGEIQQFKDVIDGIVLLGASAVRMQGVDEIGGQPYAFTGLPTIVVDNLFKLQPMAYKTLREKGRAVLASLDREGILPKATSDAMFADLVAKIRILDALRRLRYSKILFIKNPSTDIDGVDFGTLPPRYNEMIVGRVKECFGTEFVFRDVEDLLDAYRQTDDDEARAVADIWMNEALSVQDNLEGEVLKSARLYKAIEKIKNETLREDPAAIMINQEYRAVEEGLTTTTSLPMTEFQKRGIIGCYQSYTGTTLAQLLAWFMVGRMSFVHDDVIDIQNNITLHMHCGTPINDVWGNRDLTYRIRDYTTGSWHEDLQHRDGAVPAEASFPIGVPVTVWKVFPLRKKITLFTGTSVDGRALYAEWDDIICRNKLPVQVTDAEQIQYRRQVLEYGLHRTATFGDLRQTIKHLATFIGFEVEEWDR